MAFNIQTSTRNKHQFAARLVSNKTGATISWVNITDDFTRKIFGKTYAHEVTAAQAEEVLPQYLGSTNVSCIITDMTAEIAVVPIADF